MVYRYLTQALNEFCDTQDLPHESADDILALYDLTPQQREWLKAFVVIWEATDNV